MDQHARQSAAELHKELCEWERAYNRAYFEAPYAQAAGQNAPPLPPFPARLRNAMPFLPMDVRPGPQLDSVKRELEKNAIKEACASQRYRATAGSVSAERAPLLKYRSPIKRAILVQLTQNPDATDLEICRQLDADGGVELPKGWKSRPTDRLFADAYVHAARRNHIHVMISKIRRDMRKRGLLASR